MKHKTLIIVGIVCLAAVAILNVVLIVISLNKKSETAVAPAPIVQTQSTSQVDSTVATKSFDELEDKKEKEEKVKRPANEYKYSGTIYSPRGNTSVVITLTRHGNNYSGTYYYKNTMKRQGNRSSSYIDLDGSVDGHNFSGYATYRNDHPGGEEWDGTLTENKFSGNIYSERRDEWWTFSCKRI